MILSLPDEYQKGLYRYFDERVHNKTYTPNTSSSALTLSEPATVSADPVSRLVTRMVNLRSGSAEAERNTPSDREPNTFDFGKDEFNADEPNLGDADIMDTAQAPDEQAVSVPPADMMHPSDEDKEVCAPQVLSRGHGSVRGRGRGRGRRRGARGRVQTQLEAPGLLFPEQSKIVPRRGRSATGAKN